MSTPALLEAESAPSRSVRSAPTQSAAQPAQPTKRRDTLPTWAGPVLAVGVMAAFAALLLRTLVDLDLAAVAQTALTTPSRLVGLSLALSTLSYAALIGYDAYAVRAATTKAVRFGTVALGSFTSYAIGHALGFPLVTAGAVRWRIYGAAQSRRGRRAPPGARPLCGMEP
jgi:phosphatidylglycerol lysyltransferase